MKKVENRARTRILEIEKFENQNVENFSMHNFRESRMTFRESRINSRSEKSSRMGLKSNFLAFLCIETLLSRIFSRETTQPQSLQKLIRVHNIINVHTFKKPQNNCIKYILSHQIILFLLSEFIILSLLY